MNAQIKIVQVYAMEEPILDGLSDLLINAVNDGASIGFIAPLKKKDAINYWRESIQNGVKLWIAEFEGEVVGTVQLQLGIKANAAHRAEVAKLMVHTMYRRIGIARMLMEVVQDNAIKEGQPY